MVLSTYHPAHSLSVLLCDVCDVMNHDPWPKGQVAWTAKEVEGYCRDLAAQPDKEELHIIY